MSDGLYQRGDVWWFKVQVAGHVYRRSLRTSSKTVAKRLAAIEVAKLKEFAVTGNENRSYKEAVLQWTREFLPSKRPATARRYKASARVLNETFGPMQLSAITRAVVAKYVSGRKGKAKDATIRRDLTALASILRFAVSSGWIDENPAKQWDRSILAADTPKVPRLHQSSFDATIKEAPYMMAALARFLLSEGVRLEEAAGLTWDRVDLNARTIRLPMTKTRPRTVRISHDGADLLKKLPRALECDYVFHHDGASRYVALSSGFGKVRARAQKAAREAGVEFRPFRLHDLRHEFAIRELQSKRRNLYALAQHLGHNSVTTTERFYLSFLPEDEHEAAKQTAAR